MVENKQAAYLHVLYSGSSEGGAQEFAYELARQLGFKTYSIRPGSIAQKLRESGFTAVKKEELAKETYDKVVLSDIRALVWWISRRSLLARKVYFVPHNDKLNRLVMFVKFIRYFYPFLILPTTRLQALTYASTPEFFYLKKPEQNIEQRRERTKAIAYWGRFGKEKRLTKLVSIFEDSKLAADGWRLLIIGDGPYPPKHDAPGVVVQKGWLQAADIQSLVGACTFSLNIRKEEGVSLMALESLAMGIIPLFHSKKTASNYYKQGEYIPIRSGRDLVKAVHMRHLAAESILERFYHGASDIIEAIESK